MKKGNHIHITSPKKKNPSLLGAALKQSTFLHRSNAGNLHWRIEVPDSGFRDPGPGTMTEDGQTQPRNKDQFSSQANTPYTGETGQLICEAETSSAARAPSHMLQP